MALPIDDPVVMVSIVGAGPGDPGLITVRGLAALQRADVVVYDRLANPALLAEAPSDAERINAGKSTGNHSLSQADINALLIDRARRGYHVVRLKGGDPFIFGRGGEEAQALADAGIPYEVIPGVTSAIAVPAAAGIPVTHRGLANAVTIVSGQEGCTGEGEETLVVLMGVAGLPSIVRKLLAGGRAPATPAAVIQEGTTSRQRIVKGTLADIVARAQAAEVEAPAVIVIGAVAAFAGMSRELPSAEKTIA